MSKDLNNHNFLIKLNKLRDQTKDASIFRPWFIDSSEYARKSRPFAYYFPKISFILTLLLITIMFEFIFNKVDTADHCNPAKSKAEWNANKCEETFGESWEEYAWPNRY